MTWKWTIEYWNSRTKEVECFSSEDGTWEEAPRENVIYVYIQKQGVRPYGRPDKIYTMVLNGVDNYYFHERKDGTIVFGSWMDDPTRFSIKNIWRTDGFIESHKVWDKPAEISDDEVKIGVWVKEPWARRLGLSWSPNSADAPQMIRKIKGCLAPD